MTGKNLSGDVIAVAVAGTLVVLLMIAGCLGNEGGAATSPSQQITVTGSTTVLPIAERAKEAFEAKDASAAIMVSGGGSSVGIKAVGEGTADIGMASRDLKPEETAGYPDIVRHEIASDAILLIVNQENIVESLTLDKVRGIYNGTYTAWDQVGGPDQPIVVIGRDSASGTREFFSEYVLKKEDFVKTQEEFNSNGGIQQKVSRTPGAIGYVGLGYTDAVKPLALDVNGTIIEPTLENVSSGLYPISRPLFMLTSGEPEGLVQQYLEFIMSDEGQEIVASLDYIPVWR
ncbi:phosphate ABC transporter substrate-binding protein [Methanoculleus sp. YWC-01]|jgi:phosphate transport system substrate-binding protein|uniref:Phosphate ABC transporter substrate-binding protein n=1 Tax=Methanoculleus nereidis TaxID=2735141 RepID=A0ABU3YYI0_9EURY|nr:phosphate ABC transporter substrate-binding protein [Methanoculleus sp. YWC-01]MCK9298359.1 phosphate ABC transporter substrate-binding protein [Methanoculleus sp.]MDV4341625.1 phosphate ABC transporter substrate-binding protein [Methanoculleus sp. YWC-01]PKL56840.1 MAG: phosphate-binding protein [Methanomicrobiales archaeon HGW-Methanomicrobiales-6]